MADGGASVPMGRRPAQTQTGSDAGASGADLAQVRARQQELRPKYVFPLIRHLSWRVSAWLSRTPVTPNQITLIGAIVGIAGIILFLQGGLAGRLLGLAAFVFNYLCDHCDGEVARLTGRTSRFGDVLSEVCGALFHGSLFFGLGWKMSVVTGDPLWFWCGVSTAVAALLNLAMALLLKEQSSDQDEADCDLSQPVRPTQLGHGIGLWDRLVYVFRELLRADLWILFVVLGVFDLLWLLIVPAAIGSHLYWMAGLTRSARKFHV